VLLKITPLEITKQEFKKSMRGYHTEEVETFLEIVGTAYEKLLNDNKEHEKKILELETELKNYKEVERTLKQTLMSLQESSQQSRENSKKEADLIMKEAELTAAKMLEKARREKQTMQEQVITLQTQKQSLITRLRHVLTSQLELMDILDMDDADMSQLKDRSKKVFSGVKESISKEETRIAAQTNQSSENDEKSDLMGNVLNDSLS
jgi:cell division initiation protein